MVMACLAACGGNNGSKKTAPEAGKETAAKAKFPYPEVPAYLSEPGAAQEYVAVRFWDKFFANPQNYQDRDLIEGAFSTYATLLNAVSPEVIAKAQEKLLSQAEKSQLEWPEGGMMNLMLEFCDHYFDDPNSPYRNEECYLPVVDKILASEYADEASKARAAHLKPLHGVKAERTLLFFSNPGCENCKEIIDALSNSPAVQAMIAEGKLKVVNIYPDADLTEWYNYLSHYPEEWITGFDAEGILNRNTIYYLRAIPSLYLLDAEKRVILKDAPLERVLQRL